MVWSSCACNSHERPEALTLYPAKSDRYIYKTTIGAARPLLEPDGGFRTITAERTLSKMVLEDALLL